MAFDNEKLNSPASHRLVAKVVINLSVAVTTLTRAIQAVESGNKEAAKEALEEARTISKEMTEYFDELTGWKEDV